MSSVKGRRAALLLGPRLLGTALLGGAFAGAALLPGCASAPSRFYQLRAIPGATLATPGTGLQLRRVGIPGTLDRAAIVRSGDGSRLMVAENDLWGEPFGDMVTRVLAEDLRLRLPGATVVAEGAAVDAGSPLILEVELQHFEAVGGTVLLQGQAALRRRNAAAPLALQSLNSETPVQGGEIAAVVQAMSTALAGAADSLAAAVGQRTAGG